MSKKTDPMILPEDDTCGRRSGLDRRKFSYTLYVPERRSGYDRRALEKPVDPSFSMPDAESLNRRP
jgi:hypothetical protein